MASVPNKRMHGMPPLKRKPEKEPIISFWHGVQNTSRNGDRDGENNTSRDGGRDGANDSSRDGGRDGANDSSRDGGRDGTSVSTRGYSSRGLTSGSENQNVKMVIQHARDPKKARVTSIATTSVATESEIVNALKGEVSYLKQIIVTNRTKAIEEKLRLQKKMIEAEKKHAEKMAELEKKHAEKIAEMKLVYEEKLAELEKKNVKHI